MESRDIGINPVRCRSARHPCDLLLTQINLHPRQFILAMQVSFVRIMCIVIYINYNKDSGCLWIL